MTNASEDHPRTIIVGAGIVGSALAAFLSEDPKSNPILLIDRSFSNILGSTEYAPGFLGQFNQSKVLTKLAVDSLKDYERFPETFVRAGGLELAASDDGIRNLQDRCKRSKEAGLSARMLSPEERDTLVPDFVNQGSFKQALHFPTDGVVDAASLCLAYRAMAQNQGVQTLEVDITSLEIVNSTIRGVRTSTDSPSIKADKVILATGIWSSLLTNASLPSLPLPVVPVAHPYVYTTIADNPLNTPTPPFCRWPESYIYARLHTPNRLGLGTYAHAPLHIPNPGPTALEPWPLELFGPLIAASAEAKLEPGLAAAFKQETETDTSTTTGKGREVINGVFSVTPDNLPLLGAVPGVQGLSLAVAVWITHAAGCARLMARMLTGEIFDEEMARMLEPGRFGDACREKLRETALRQYNDIYRSELGE